MRRLSASWVLAATVIAVVLTSGTPVMAAQSRESTSCGGSTDIWTGQAGDTFWTTGGNWSTNSPPAANDVAVLPTVTADNVDLTGDATVCELQLQAQAHLLVDAGHTVSAQEVDIAGGPADNAPTSLAGQISTIDLHVEDGYTDVGAADEHTPVTETTSTFELDAGAHFALDDSAVTLKAIGLATLGGSGGPSFFDSKSTSDGDDSASFDVDATAMLAGAVDSSGLDVVTTASSVIDTEGYKWSLDGDAFSKLAGGTTIQSSASGGVFAIGNQDHLLVSGALDVAAGTTLLLQGTGTITDGRYFDTNGVSPATVNGPGALDWTGGEVTGHVNLAPSLTTDASGGGGRHVSDPSFDNSVLTNEGSFTLQGGSVIVDGSRDSFVNTGDLTVTGGHFGANNSSAPPIANARGGHWTFAPSGSTSSTIANGSFRNAGTLTIAANTTLTVGDAFRQAGSGTTLFTVSSSTAASRIRAGALFLAGTAHVSSAHGYAPTQATLRALLHGGSLQGTFTHVRSTTHRQGTAWQLKYVGARVDAVLS